MTKPLIGKRDKKKLVHHLLCLNCNKLRAAHRAHDNRCPRKRNQFSRMPNDMICHSDESMIFDPSDKIQLSKSQRERKLTQAEAVAETLNQIKSFNLLF